MNEEQVRLHKLNQYDIFTMEKSISGISDELKIDIDSVFYCQPNKNGSLSLVSDIENLETFFRIVKRDSFDEKDGITIIVSKDKESTYDKTDEDKVIQMYLFERYLP